MKIVFDLLQNFIKVGFFFAFFHPSYSIQDASSRTRKQHIPKPVLNEHQRDRSPGSRSPVPDSPHTDFGGDKKSPMHQSTNNHGADPWAMNAQDPWGTQAPPPYTADKRSSKR